MPEVKPHAACLAIAGPIVRNTSQLTNLSWFLRGEFLMGALDIESVQLINDFEAIGYGVMGLKPEDIYELQAGKPDESAPIAVLGAGTGLGQGFLLPCNGEYQVFPSEGGHVDFAPQSELEFQLRKYLIEKHGISRVSEERVVSGMGHDLDLSVFARSPVCQRVSRNWPNYGYVGAQGRSAQRTRRPSGNHF